MQPYNRFACGAVVGMLAIGLAGCSEYLDRRDGLSVQGGNAVQTNKVAQMVDPWPRDSGDGPPVAVLYDRSRNDLYDGAG